MLSEIPAESFSDMESLAEALACRLKKAAEKKESGFPAVLAIDGRCASGKSTLAQRTAEKSGALLIHMDDYFLQPFQRTEERRKEAGGNLDRERVISQILEPLQNGQPLTLQKFDCRTMTLLAAEEKELPEILILEGSYSMHPGFLKYDLYDLKVFLSCPKKIQEKRILRRNGAEKLKAFRNQWIPMEEQYFSTFHTEQNADLSICTESFF